MCVERDEIRYGTALSSEKVCWGTGYPDRQVEGEALLPRRSVGTGDTGACEVGINGSGALSGVRGVHRNVQFARFRSGEGAKTKGRRRARRGTVLATIFRIVAETVVRHPRQSPPITIRCKRPLPMECVA